MKTMNLMLTLTLMTAAVAPTQAHASNINTPIGLGSSDSTLMHEVAGPLLGLAAYSTSVSAMFGLDAMLALHLAKGRPMGRGFAVANIVLSTVNAVVATTLLAVSAQNPSSGFWSAVWASSLGSSVGSLAFSIVALIKGTPPPAPRAGSVRLTSVAPWVVNSASTTGGGVSLGFAW